MDPLIISGPPTITTSNSYNFKISFTKPLAFSNYISEKFPDINPNVINVVDNYVTIQFSNTLTDMQQENIQTYIDNYKDPAYFLSLIETQNQCLNTIKINDPLPQIVQTFILSPQTDPTLVIADMKTIIQISLDDISKLQIVGNESIVITITLFDLTRNIQITQILCDITSQIGTWNNMLSNGTTGPVYAWKSVQIYGLKDSMPDHDCIWQFKLSVNNANVNVSLTCLQNLIYSIS